MIIKVKNTKQSISTLWRLVDLLFKLNIFDENLVALFNIVNIIFK